RGSAMLADYLYILRFRTYATPMAPIPADPTQAGRSVSIYRFLTDRGAPPVGDSFSYSALRPCQRGPCSGHQLLRRRRARRLGDDAQDRLGTTRPQVQPLRIRGPGQA